MNKETARAVLIAVKHLEAAIKVLEKITDKAVEQDCFYTQDGRFEDMQGMADEARGILRDYQHREYSALIVLGHRDKAEKLVR